MNIDIIAGARPNFMKIAPIIRALKETGISYRLIHTGQHYDKVMSEQFFSELEIPEPHENLGAGGGTQAEQTAKIMMGYEQLLAKKSTDLCLVVGDVTSTMACAIVAKKAHIAVAHVEAGIRSGDMAMPEEVNRIVTDAITDYFFTTTPEAGANLMRQGIPDNRIFFVGNTMIDTLLWSQAKFKKPEVFDVAGLQNKNYLVLTLHRPSNVDQEAQLENMLQTINDAAGSYKVVFPVHPRTQAQLQKQQIKLPNILMVPPMGYMEFNYLVQNSAGVITDSGGITEETTVMGIPCITLRNSTERPETVTIGTNVLAGTDPNAIKKHLQELVGGSWKKGGIPQLWDGKTAERIVAQLSLFGEKA